jgi:squalene monooxygenase
MDHIADIDVLVGGAGVAGLAAAAAVQQLGYKVVLVEPGQNDDRRLAGEVFHPPGVAGLGALGLLSAVKCDPAVTVNGFSVWSEGECSRLAYDSVPSHDFPGLCLTHGLIRQRMLTAVSALPNVSIKQGRRVVGVDHSDQAAVTVTVANGGESRTHYRARLLIAADGASSRIARLAGIGVDNRRISTILGYRTSTKNLPEHEFGHVFLGAETPVLLYPISRHEARILFDIPLRPDRHPRADDCLAMLSGLPQPLREEVEAIISTQPKMSVVAQASNTDCSARGRVVLVGDAGGSCHPLTATGMTMCVRDALVLQESLAEYPTDVLRALQNYESRRKWPQTTRLILAEALRETFCGTTMESRVMRQGILARWRESVAGRTAALALLSTADGRPLALLQQIVAAMARGFIVHWRDGNRQDSFRLARALAVSFYQHARQMLNHA